MPPYRAHIPFALQPPSTGNKYKPCRSHQPNRHHFLSTACCGHRETHIKAWPLRKGQYTVDLEKGLRNLNVSIVSPPSDCLFFIHIITPLFFDLDAQCVTVHCTSVYIKRKRHGLILGNAVIALTAILVIGFQFSNNVHKFSRFFRLVFLRCSIWELNI